MEPEAPASVPESPPPEALVIRTAREAAGMTMAQSAKATNGTVSATYWRDVERGYGGRRGQRAPARASARLLAVMAQVTGVTPDELDKAQREDAARVLAEIQRREAGSAAAPALSAVPPRPPLYAPGDMAGEAITLLLDEYPTPEWHNFLSKIWALPQDDRLDLLLQALRFRAHPEQPQPPAAREERRSGSAS